MCDCQDKALFGRCILHMRDKRHERMDKMKRLFIAMLLVVALGSWSAAQSAPVPPDTTQQGTAAQGSTTQTQNTQAQSTQAQSANQFPSGTIIPVELSKSVD